MLMPKRTKFRKMQKGRVKGLAQRGARVTFGDFGIKALDAGWITSRQIEAARIAMTRRMKRQGKVWIRVFPDKPITKKPAETRMGKGKGSPEYWVAVVKPGRILFEIGGVDEELAREALRLAIQKLPIKAKFVARPEMNPVAPPPSMHTADAESGVEMTVTNDDLTKVYGLGDAMAESLQKEGVRTYAALADLSLDRLREIVEADGTSEASVNEETWTRQARLLADGKLDELNDYVDELRAEDGNEVDVPATEAAPAPAAPVEEPAAEEPAAEKPVADEPAAAEEPETVEEPAAEAAPEAPAADAKPDDLTKVYGIGKVFEAALHNAGITTFAQLAKADVETLRGAISDGSSTSDSAANEESWAEQAQLLADGDKDGFKAMLDKLRAEKKASKG